MIQVSGPLIWNSIPQDIQNAGTISTFKKQLKKLMFSEYNGEGRGNTTNSRVILTKSVPLSRPQRKIFGNFFSSQK